MWRCARGTLIASEWSTEIVLIKEFLARWKRRNKCKRVIACCNGLFFWFKGAWKRGKGEYGEGKEGVASVVAYAFFLKGLLTWYIPPHNLRGAKEAGCLLRASEKHKDDSDYTYLIRCQAFDGVTLQPHTTSCATTINREKRKTMLLLLNNLWLRILNKLVWQ